MKFPDSAVEGIGALADAEPPTAFVPYQLSVPPAEAVADKAIPCAPAHKLTGLTTVGGFTAVAVTQAPTPPLQLPPATPLLTVQGKVEALYDDANCQVVDPSV